MAEMTKEQFQAGIRELLKDIKEPDGELAGIRNDFHEIYTALAPHDAELATHMAEIMHAMDRMFTYVQSRAS